MKLSIDGCFTVIRIFLLVSFLTRFAALLPFPKQRNRALWIFSKTWNCIPIEFQFAKAILAALLSSRVSRTSLERKKKCQKSFSEKHKAKYRNIFVSVSNGTSRHFPSEIFLRNYVPTLYKLKQRTPFGSSRPKRESKVPAFVITKRGHFSTHSLMIPCDWSKHSVREQKA